MKPNILNMKKSQVEWLHTHLCKKHSHSYLEHYDCYLKDEIPDAPYKEKLGHLDIETSDLNANFGYIFSYAIKEDAGKILGRVLLPNEVRSGAFDKALVGEMCRDLRKFDRVTTYYGGDHRFDLPFMRTRALFYRADFPLYREVLHTDIYPIVRNKLKLNRNRLATVCMLLGIPAKGHYLNPTIWCNARAGDKKSLDYIWRHNCEDVESLEAVAKVLLPYQKSNKGSV